MTASSKRACEMCNMPNSEDDLCGDGYCRECHVSLSFEECCDGSWARRFRAAAGFPPAEGDEPLPGQPSR